MARKRPLPWEVPIANDNDDNNDMLPPSSSAPRRKRQTTLNFGIVKSQESKAESRACPLLTSKTAVDTSFTTDVTTSFWSDVPADTPNSSPGTSSVDDVDQDAGSQAPIADYSKLPDASELNSSAVTTAYSSQEFPILPSPSDQEDKYFTPDESQASDYLQSSLDSVEFALLAEAEEVHSPRQGVGEGFAHLELRACHASDPFMLQWETQRVLQTLCTQVDIPKPASYLAKHWQHPRTLESLYEAANTARPAFKESPYARSLLAGSAPSERLTLSSRLKWAASRSGPLFDLMLNELKEDDPCDMQRRFGADKILYIDMPALYSPTDQHKGRDITSRFEKTFRSPVELLGRKWQLLNLQEIKKAKNNKARTPSTQQQGALRLVLVALETIAVADIFNYVFDYPSNKQQHAAKAYARTDLHMSRTVCTIDLAESDIAYLVSDSKATAEPENDPFLDPAFQSAAEKDFNADMVMSDGCCHMSPWLATRINQSLKNLEDRSAFQCRIAGAKGVWFSSSEPRLSNIHDKPAGPQIQIAQSQVKVHRQSLGNCHSRYLSLNVVRANSLAKSSVLHVEFLPILLDRGVTRETIMALVKAQATQRKDEIIQAVTGGPDRLRGWLCTWDDYVDENKERHVDSVAGFAIDSKARIVQMLEAGFDVCKNSFLANEFKHLVEDMLDLEKRKYKIRLPRSVTLMGVADLTKCLAPGEIHISFRPGLKDPATGQMWQNLHNQDVLVARNPAMAPWDIQKVKCVYKTELAHLTDLVVFSTRGLTPLAAKLQGGDYDGDTFWVCWDASLTKMFRNIPLPCDVPDLDAFGIRKDDAKLQDFVTDPSSNDQWGDWACKMATARFKRKLLGAVTNIHTRLIYKQGGIDSDEALMLVHLHDYLIDADKQGYHFSDDDFAEFRKRYNVPSRLPKPAYWKFTRSGEIETTHPVDNDAVENNIIDGVFEVIAPIHEDCKQKIRELLQDAQPNDDDLANFYRTARESAVDKAADIIGENLQHLKASLRRFRDFYQAKSLRPRPTREELQALRAEYDAIRPKHENDPVIKEWLRDQGSGLTTWARLKASALAELHHNTIVPGKLLFNTAGSELCELKTNEVDKKEAGGARNIRTMLGARRENLKPKKHRRCNDVMSDS